MTQFSIMSFTPRSPRVVDERREDALGLAQVLGDAAAGIAADERADGHAAERGRRVDARAHVRVVGVALGRVRIEVVVVVGERREDEAVVVERAADAIGLGLVERVGRDVAGGEGTVAQLRPGGELERLVAVRAGPRRDLLEAALGHAGGEEAELHRATARVSEASGRLPPATSTQVSPAAEASTASVICAARRPSAKSGSPSDGAPVAIAS